MLCTAAVQALELLQRALPACSGQMAGHTSPAHMLAGQQGVKVYAWLTLLS